MKCGTLGIILVIWLISNVRSVQKLSKQLDANLQDVHRYVDEVKEDTGRDIAKLSDKFNREFEILQEDLDKRFDKSYRTMYEFRDWADEQITRLIETDLNNESKKKTK